MNVKAKQNSTVDRASFAIVALAGAAVLLTACGDGDVSTDRAEAVCGDGVRKASEETCDDGNTISEIACPYGTPTCTTCNATCSAELALTGNVCGDGSLDPTNEVCDDSNTIEETSCPSGEEFCVGCNGSCSSKVTIIPDSGQTGLSVGDAHSCVLLVTGAVKCWGQNDVGQLGDSTTDDRQSPVQVIGIDGVNATATSISAGDNYTCALLATGALSCWGGPLTRTTPVQDATIDGITHSAVAVEVGRDQACALLETGAVWCSNPWTAGFLTTPFEVLPELDGLIARAVSISFGDRHGCAVLDTGALQCWGQNSDGQLGNGSNTPSDVPVTVTGLDGTGPAAISVSAGFLHTCALLESGALECWGKFNDGRLGVGTATGASYTEPHTVEGLDGSDAIVVDFAVGSKNACAVLSTGAVRCWGSDQFGQLGDGGANSQSLSPVAVQGLDGINASAVAVSVGEAHVCAHLDSGAVQCWGQGGYGRLGDGSIWNSSSRSLPASVFGLDGSSAQASTTAIVLGQTGHACALIGNGEVRCWGYGEFGQLAGGEYNQPIPVTATALAESGETFTQLAAGSTHTCVLSDVGNMRCWGTDRDGQLGNNNSTPVSAPPSLVSGITNITQMDAEGTHSCAVLDTGAAYCWGRDNVGQLGDGGTLSSRAVPSAVVGIDGVSARATRIATGSKHTCALLDTGAVNCWGDNVGGQLGNSGSQTRKLAPDPVTGIDGVNDTALSLAVGYQHTCVALTTGVVKCWGSDQHGQLGDDLVRASQDAPTAVSGIDGVSISAVSVSASGDMSCAVLDTGAHYCWGGGFRGALDGSGSDTDQFTPVALADLGDLAASIVSMVGRIQSTCAYLDTGAAYCWGSDSSGVLGDDHRWSAGNSTLPVLVSAVP